MTATLTHTLGKFVWREHFTRDLEASKRFYTQLFGWRVEEAPMGPDFTYTLLYNGDRQIGGMMDIRHIPGGGEGIPAHWAVYVSVEDVDAAAKKAEELGGKVVSHCMDIPNVGRFAVIQDPQGAHFNLFRSAHGDPADTMGSAGDFCWESLNTTDLPKALPFYQEVVGWGVDKMGEMSLFTRKAEGDPERWTASTGEAVGAPPHWLTFVAVANIGEMTDKARSLGAQVLVEPTPIPTVGAFSIVQDPVGAIVALFEGQQG